MSADDPTRLIVLKEILEQTELFLGEDGAVYAQFLRDGRQVTYGTDWPEFLTWVKGQAVERLNSIPSAILMKQAIAEVEYEVRLKRLPYPVALRLYPDECSAVLHLGDGKMLDIRASGAVLNADAGVVFPTKSDMECLPKLEDADELGVLAEILDLSEDQCLLVLIWLIAQFQADGRRLVLIISGPKQSGKSWLATIIRRLLDPHPVPLLPMPSSLDELKAAVRDNATLAFDNVEDVSDCMEEALLALAEGTAMSIGGHSRPVKCKLPAILVCDELPDAPDLLENAIIVRLKERPVQQIKSKHLLDRAFVRQWGKVLGFLVKLCSTVLRHRDAIELTEIHKDAALEKWILAADKSLNLEGRLMAAFVRNLERAIESIIEDRPAVRAFRALVRAKGSVKATATELLEQIEPFLDGPKDARYPTTGKAFALLLREYERFMAEIDVEFNVRTGKDRDRNIVAIWKFANVGIGNAAEVPRPRKPVAKASKAKRETQEQPTLL